MATTYNKGTSLSENSNIMKLSERDKREIEKFKEIIYLLNGMSIIEVKHVISKIEAHLDSVSCIDKELYTANVEPIIEIFK